MGRGHVALHGQRGPPPWTLTIRSSERPNGANRQQSRGANAGNAQLCIVLSVNSVLRRWQEVARRQHDAVTSRKEYA